MKIDKVFIDVTNKCNANCTTDARGNVTTTVQDVSGRIVSVTDAEGNATTYAYGEPIDSPTVITDALGHTSCYAYDMRGRKIAEWGTALQPAVFSYDNADHLTSLRTFRTSGETITTDPRERTDGDTTTWTYHKAGGLLMRKTYPDGTHEDTAYNILNMVANTTDARGVRTTYGYDLPKGVNTSVTFSDGTPGIVYTYNHLAQMTRVTDDAGTREFSYNQYNELEAETTAGLAPGILTYRKDSLGRDGGYSLDYGNATVQQTALGYDDAGRLSTVALNEAATPFTYGYNANNGLLETLNYPNTLKRWYTREEKRDLVIKVDYLRPGGQNYPAKVDYTYDSLGRPVTKKDYFNTPSPDLTHAYTYNDRGELTADAMSRGGTYSYAYDNIGNREMSREGTAVPTAYETNELNQYTSIGEGEQAVFVPEHDAAGNQTKIRTATGEWRVAYNALNQAVSFTQGDKRVECRYDYRGRRVEKSVYEGEALVARKRFLYRNYLQIAELDATDTTEEATPILRKTYLWDPMESSATRILAMSLFDEAGTYQEDLYCTHDLLKNTTALFGIQAGRRGLYEYGPYGNVIKMEGNAAEQNPFRFSSEYADDEMGLVYYNYRYLNPMDGRWIGRDSIVEDGGNNLYNFVYNRVSMDTDYLGEHISLEKCQKALTQFEKSRGKSVLDLIEKNKCKITLACDCFDEDVKAYALVSSPTPKESSITVNIRFHNTPGAVKGTIRHEYTHALDYCTKGHPKTCSDYWQNELRAAYCGDCRNKTGEDRFECAQKQARRSMYNRKFPTKDECDYTKYKTWQSLPIPPDELKLFRNQNTNCYDL